MRGKLDTSKQMQELLNTLIPLLEGMEHSGVTVTLPAENWVERVQTIQNGLFQADSHYWYFVCGDADNFSAWSEACITGDNITTDGEMVFHCLATPTVDLTVNILRLEVETTDE